MMSKIEEIKNEFKSLLKEDLKTAIQAIETSISYDSKSYDDLIMFYSQISILNRDNHLQVISYDDYTLRVNKIRKGLIEIINELQIEDLKTETKKDSKKQKSNDKTENENPFERISYGEFKGKNGEYKLTIEPTVLFLHRLGKAFPGVRGIKWFEGEKAIKRLSLLLREPTRFDIANGYGLYSDPIWWFRGRSGCPVQRFKILSHGKCLINHDELKIKNIAAYNSSSYYRCFVYVEVEGENPIGLYKYSEDYIDKVVRWRGYFNEEYGLFDGIPIKREELDDGAAEINGEIVDTSEAEVRGRYLTSYNFILVAKSSPFNSREGNKLGDEYMNAILKGDKSLEEFAEKSELLDKNWMDM